MAQQFDWHPLREPVEKAQAQVQQETAPRPVRRARTILFQGLVIAAISVFAVLALLARTTAYFSFDLTITRALQTARQPVFSALMQMVSWPGFSPQAVLIVLLVGVALYILGLRWEAAAALIAAALTLGVNTLVKTLIHRPRPSADLVQVFARLNDYSFPSGHVMFYTGFFGFLFFLAFTLLKPSWKRTVWLVIFGALVLLVGASRIYLGEHWASDVLGGYLLGSLCLAANVQIYYWGKNRFFVHQPVAGGGT